MNGDDAGARPGQKKSRIHLRGDERSDFHPQKKGERLTAKGITAEDLKEADDETIELMQDIFNMIIKQNSLTPSTWKKVMLNVIFKKGEPTRLESYSSFVRYLRCTNYFRLCSISVTASNLLTKVGFRKEIH